MQVFISKLVMILSTVLILHIYIYIFKFTNYNFLYNFQRQYFLFPLKINPKWWTLKPRLRDFRTIKGYLLRYRCCVSAAYRLAMFIQLTVGFSCHNLEIFAPNFPGYPPEMPAIYTASRPPQRVSASTEYVLPSLRGFVFGSIDHSFLLFLAYVHIFSLTPVICSLATYLTQPQFPPLLPRNRHWLLGHRAISSSLIGAS